MSRFLALLFLPILAACAASAPPRVARSDTVAANPANREAVLRLVNAKIAELREDYARAAGELERAVLLDSTSVTLFHALARNQLMANNLIAARRAAGRAVALDSTSSELRWLYTRILQRGGDDSSAAGELEKLLTLTPRDLQVYGQLSEIYHRTGQRPRLVDLLDRLSRLEGLSQKTRLYVASLYAESGEMDRAEAAWRSILKEDPRAGEAWEKVARVQLSRRDTVSAAATCRQAVARLDLKENEPIGQLLVGLYRAESLLEPVLREAPPDTAFLFALGRSFVASRDTSVYRSAVRVLERAAEVARPTASQWIDLSHAYRGLGDPERAIDILRKATDLYPREGDLPFNLGYALMGAGRNDEAALAFGKAIELDPDNPMYRYGMGMVQQRRKQWVEAAGTFQGLADRVGKTPLYIDVLFSLGSSLERSGRFQESVEVFQKLINLAPRHAEALNYLGYMFAEKGVRLEEAEGLIKRALEIDGDNGAFLDSLGWTFHQLGRHQEAEELLDRAIRAEIARKADGEGLAVIWDHIGENARALGKTRKALEAWGHALRATPGDRKIEAKLQALEKAPRKP